MDVGEWAIRGLEEVRQGIVTNRSEFELTVRERKSQEVQDLSPHHWRNDEFIRGS
jgi:hypothetical protein